MDNKNTFTAESFVPALLLGYLKEDGKVSEGKVAVTPLTEDFKVTPITVAAMMVSVYDCWERNVPEFDQVEFEKQTLDYFVKMFELRFGHTVKYYLKDE